MSHGHRFSDERPLRDEDGTPVPRVGNRLKGLEFAKHEDRARESLARHVCSVRLTDGFCDPRNRPDCRCWTEARGLIDAMATVGVIPVWFFQIDRPDEAKPKPPT